MLHKEFLSGHYQNTINAFFADDSKSVSGDNLPSLVGALSFTGRLFEADKIFKRYKSLDSDKSVKNLEIHSACLFFLGLGHTRKSKYKLARKIFRANQLSLNESSTALQRFYIYQGIAFYLFFIGKLELAEKWTNKSFENALASKNLYARSLSTDLLGHIKLRIGEINAGIDLLKKAAELSHKLGNISVAEAVEVSELQYRAQYGYKSHESFEELIRKFNHIQTEDSYSKAVVGLELARQLTLRGQYTRCVEVLEEISNGIFSSENRRQEILLNLRFAENHYQLGRESQAWNYLRSARRCLDFEADKSFEMQILGFESKLFKGDKGLAVNEQLLIRTKQFNSVINQNILKRKSLLETETFNHEDLYHEFLLSLENAQDPVGKIIDSGYWSLLYTYCDFPRGKEGLFVDINRNRIILFSEKKIDVPLSGLTPMDMKLLLNLLNGKATKDELCKNVWGYVYETYRHDMMIYTAISSLRKNLSFASAWVETTENGYELSADRIFKIKDEAPVTTSRTHQLNLSSDLNLRQMKALSYLKKSESIDVSAYKAMFKVSDITASRDLRALKESGLVVSIGKARAIKYLLNLPENGEHYEN